MVFKRSSGVLLHLTSLPGPHGIGDLGTSAHRVLNWLELAGQSWWQTLPVTPLGYGDSPYNSLSAFAGNPLLMDLESLVKDDLLSPFDLEVRQPFPPGRVKYSHVRRYKDERLKKAFATFKPGLGVNREFQHFIRDNTFWLDDYALFQTLRTIHRGAAWTSWRKEYRLRDPESLAAVRTQFAADIMYHQFLQFHFHRQWQRLRAAAHRRGIRLMGDIPIYVAHDSADVWAHPNLFKLRPDGKPQKVAGVPPDYFSRSGQLWGNPVYRWEAHQKENFQWWVNRFQRSTTLFDGVRLDHFIGYHRTWEVPYGEKTAKKGRWSAGPREKFFKKLLGAMGIVPMVAEDLGLMIPPVQKLREKFGFPGMYVLHFAFHGTSEETRERLQEIPENSVVFTGTHDNNTTRGWVLEKFNRGSTRNSRQIRMEKQNVRKIFGSTGREIHWAMIDLALSLKSDLAIVPMQDILGLGAGARMNLPGSKTGNWEWRMKPDDLSPALAEKLRAITRKYERLP